jgi:hypothetical protein
MGRWRSESKIAVVGWGIAGLTAIITILSDYLRKHPRFVWIMAAVSILMITSPVIHSAYVWLKMKLAPPIREPSLEIIFEPLNPSRRFWSLESKIDDYGRLVATFWEHRIEVRNNTSATLRNVTVTVERTGSMPVRPQRAGFVRTNTDSCDINPGCSELVCVNRWPNPKRQVGMLAGDSAWGYGPIKVIASAEDTAPTVVTFDFNYETERMLFERQPAAQDPA